MRTAADKKAIEKKPTEYAMRVVFFKRQKGLESDITGGALVLRFADGDFIKGNFTAKQL